MKTAERTRHPGIYRRGEKYVAVVSYSMGGRTRQKWLSRTTLRGAKDARRDFLNGLDRGLKPDGAKITLRRYIEDEWFPEIVATRRPATADRYRKSLKNHILPALGDVRLKDLDRDTLRDFYRSRPTPATAAYCHAILSSAMNYAVREIGLLAANPCGSVRPPKTERKEARHLEVEEARRMLALAKGQRLEGAIALGLVGGLRLAEVCGLKWRDIDLDAGSVLVRGSFYGPTKSGKMRGLTMPAEQVAALRRYRTNQARDLLRFGIRQNDVTPVMARWDGKAMNPDALAWHFATFVGEHGFNVSFHGLRHTAAILMLVSGVDVKTAASRLGHNPRVLLETYSHFIQSADRSAADKLGGMLSGS